MFLKLNFYLLSCDTCRDFIYGFEGYSAIGKLVSQYHP
jgi:hypothetical protein